ncbi:UNVERIFIED_CONTAM: hypothetical protein GTU68_040533 [Idotea baltica]|nr:hypothetical protein [Idotea baltica]
MKKEVRIKKKKICVADEEILCFNERDPANLPWKELEIDIVIESTGAFRTFDAAHKHIDAGAKKVIISAPGKDDNIPMYVMGVNDKLYRKAQKIISNASCTTNCLAPMVQILHNAYDLQVGMLTTVHAYTAAQKLQDAPDSDLRRARAAAFNIVPTTTGASSAVEKVLPEIKGKLTGSAIRVPVITGSLTEFTCLLKKKVSVEEINKLFKKSAAKKYKGIIEYTEKPIVSSDIIGNTHSCIFDALSTSINGKMVRVVSWYDNEFGYSSRMVDLIRRIY